MCPFGAAPASLVVLPVNRVIAGVVPMANIMDFAPGVNIATFGVCISMANPTVAAATAAAFGILTPMPCVPVTTPWIPSVPNVLVGIGPALNMGDKTTCIWGGVISILMPGQFTVL
jgi:hypothetical protein